MTRSLGGAELVRRIEARFPGKVHRSNETDVFVDSEVVADLGLFLRDDPDLRLDYLVSVTSVDYIDYFEVVYRLTSITHNHSAVLKTRAYGREEPVVPSVTSVWKGAELQEREVYDLMGVRFEGHPNMKRIMMWEGFEGHPLRKDFLLQRP